MEKTEKRRTFIINTVYFAIIVGLFYLVVKYGLAIAWPFFVAFFLAMILQSPVRFLTEKAHLKKGFASVLTVLFIVLILGSLVGLLIARIVIELKGFFLFLMMKLEDAPSFVEQATAWLHNFLSFLPESLSASASAFLENTLNKFLGLEAEIAGNLPQAPSFDFSMLSSPLGFVWGTAKQIPMFAVGLLICIVSTCFMTADYNTIRDGILFQFSKKRQKALVRAKQITFSTIGKMLKAYSIIIAVTFSEMVLGLFLLKVIGVFDGGYIFAISLITAIIDIVPVLGTGTVLVPWAIYSLCTGKFGFGIGLLVLYGAISIIRQIIEPKLVAAQLGLPPFLTIMAMFIGTQLFGFIGLFLLPMLLMLLKVLNDEGVIHVFKTKESEALRKKREAEEKAEEEAEETVSVSSSETSKDTQEGESKTND